MPGSNKVAILQFHSQMASDLRFSLGPTRGVPRLIAHLLTQVAEIQCDVRDLQRDAGQGQATYFLEDPLDDRQALQLAKASTNGASWCLHGRVDYEGEELSIATHLIAIDSAECVLAEVREGKLDDLGDLLLEVVTATLQHIQPQNPMAIDLLRHTISSDGQAMLGYLSALATSDFEERIVLFSEAVDRDATFVEAGLELAQSYIYNRQFKEAEQCLVAATQRGLISNERLREAAIQFFTRGMAYEATYLARKAMIWAPDDAQAYVPYIRIALVTGNVGDGLKYAQRAEQLDPTDPSFKAFISLFYRYLQQFDRAIEYARRAIEMKPDEAFHYYALGSAHLFSGNIRPAVRHFEKALELNPYDTTTHRELALAICNLYDGAEARQRIAQSLELLSSDPYLLTRRGQTYIADEEYELARLDLERALTQQPHFPEAHGLLSHALRETGEYERAREHAEKAHQLEPENAQWMYALGHALAALGEEQRAQSYFARAAAAEGDEDD
jgi:Flp pilus assembly protein TadD